VLCVYSENTSLPLDLMLVLTVLNSSTIGYLVAPLSWIVCVTQDMRGQMVEVHAQRVHLRMVMGIGSRHSEVVLVNKCKLFVETHVGQVLIELPISTGARLALRILTDPTFIAPHV